MRAAALIIPILALVAPLCRGNDRLAEIAGIVDEKERYLNHRYDLSKSVIERECSRFTNAVVAIDGIDSVRTMMRLSSEDGSEWSLVASYQINLNEARKTGCIGRLEGFDGLTSENTLRVHIRNGQASHRMSRELPDGRTEAFDYYRGEIKRLRNDTLIAYTKCFSYTPVMDELDILHYFDWPEMLVDKKRLEKVQTRGSLLSSRIWCMKYTVDGNGEHNEKWHFFYRRPLTGDEMKADIETSRELLRSKVES